MGAFFLSKRHCGLKINEALEIFKRKGFYKPRTFYLGEWQLYIFRKQLLDKDNLYKDKQGQYIFCCGTISYCGLSYSESLVRLLQDFKKQRIEHHRLTGNFCILFWDGRSLSILTDYFHVQHVFMNEQISCFSTSFLALLAASPKPLKINRLALCEKLATGYIIGPDTLAHGIYQLNEEKARELNNLSIGIQYIPHQKIPFHSHRHDKGIKDSVERQVHVLRQHFCAMDAINNEFSGELGLSGGYDSRLVLACSQFLSHPLSIHTHYTKGVHDTEAEIVKKICSDLKLTLTKIPTTKMEGQPEERLSEILTDGLYYFDGRCSHNMGAFSETYTRQYKIKVLGPNRLSWNGLGGELYRNYYLTWRKRINAKAWLLRHVYYPFSQETLAKSGLFDQMHAAIIDKINRRLDTSSFDNKISLLDIRRYYSEIRMPDCDGVNNNAHNQIAFFHTPFMDPYVVFEGIGATPYIGCNGAYQAALIKRLNERLASYPSHYGHNFATIPFKHMLKYWIKGKLPDNLMWKRARLLDKKNGKKQVKTFEQFISSNKILNEIRSLLIESPLKLDFSMAMYDYAQRPTTIFVGSFLREFQDKLKW